MTREEKLDKWLRGEYHPTRQATDQKKQEQADGYLREYWQKVWKEPTGEKTQAGLVAFMSTKEKERFVLNAKDDREALTYLVTAYRQVTKSRGGEMVQNNDALSMLSKVAGWLTDKDGKPSLLIVGGVGCGKTTALRAMSSVISYLNGLTPTYVTAQYVYDAIKQGRWEEIRRANLLLIDDLGTEPITHKDYGNETMPLVELLLARYKDQQPVVITSNKDLMQIEQDYGKRLGDRLAEMCEVINLGNAKSFRK